MTSVYNNRYFEIKRSLFTSETFYVIIYRIDIKICSAFVLTANPRSAYGGARVPQEIPIKIIVNIFPEYYSKSYCFKFFCPLLPREIHDRLQQDVRDSYKINLFCCTTLLRVIDEKRAVFYIEMCTSILSEAYCCYVLSCKWTTTASRSQATACKKNYNVKNCFDAKTQEQIRKQHVGIKNRGNVLVLNVLLD